MISEKTIEIIRGLHIGDIVAPYVHMKRVGAALVGICPFHNEKTPSFHVNLVKGFYKCFGCGAAGDSIRFIMEHEHKTFSEAIELIARNHNITIEYDSGKAPIPDERERQQSIFR